MRSAVAVAVVLAAGALAPAARADGFDAGSSFVIFGGSGVREVAQAQAPASVSGTITVDFHGDPAAGCAQRGLCDVSGTLTWRPARRASLSAVRFRTRKHDGLLVSLFLVGDDPRVGATTTAQTQRTGAGAACADVVTGYGGAIGGQAFGSSVRVGPGARGLGTPGDFLATRCPGPLLSDLVKLLPSVKVGFDDAAKGRRTLDLSGEGALSAGGFAGTVRSTVAVRLGHGRTAKASPPTRPRGGTKRRRELSAEYDMHVTGTAAVDLTAAADDARCAPLDACGQRGTVTLTPPAGSIETYLSAEGPASVSTARLRASLGLAGGPRPSGVRVYGAGYGSRRLAAEAVFTRGGAPGCTDRAPTGVPGISLTVGGGRLTATLQGVETDLLHTRCGGPTMGDVAGERFVARGSVPLAAMRARTVTIPLTQGRRFEAGAWHGRVRAALQVVLRREKVRTRVFREPAGP